MSVLQVCELGRTRYEESLALQERLVTLRTKDEIADTLLLQEHHPVITLGRRAKEQHLLASRDALAELGIESFESGRGGDVTYHGPGQLVGYPIVKLEGNKRDVRKYVACLEQTMIAACDSLGVRAGRYEGLQGAWVDAPRDEAELSTGASTTSSVAARKTGARKIGAVGVRISRWVTMHGFALNANTDLRHFKLIVPCGIEEHSVTSLAEELGHIVPIDELSRLTAQCFAEVYGVAFQWISRSELDDQLALSSH